MLTSKSLKLKHPEIFFKVKFIFSSKRSVLPCLFAIKSFHKLKMNFGVSLKDSNYINDIALGLNLFTRKIAKNKSVQEKTFSTYVHIIDNIKVKNVRDFLTDTLQLLNEVDKTPWLENETTDMNDPSFEFCFNGKKWFPVLLSQDHPTKIRKASLTIIAFQPSEIFHYNKTKQNKQFNQMREAIHNKINKYYLNEKPFYLTAESKGKNISQFIGFDSPSEKKYPNIVSKCPFQKGPSPRNEP